MSRLAAISRHSYRTYMQIDRQEDRMSRFIQPQPTKKAKQEKPRELPKTGSYSSDDLRNSSKIPTKGGYQ